MIESIAVTNFYCFNEKTELSFVAGRERNRILDEIYGGYTNVSRVNLLKMIYLYGDNGAGKSKLLKAFNTLHELVNIVRDNRLDPLPYHEFALDPLKDRHKPSVIEMRYHFDGKRFRYVIEWDDKAILREELYQIRLSTEIQLIDRGYNARTMTATVKFGKGLDIDDGAAYIISSALLRNNSVISVIGNTNIYNKVLHDQLAFFREGFETVELCDIDLGDSLPDSHRKQEKKLKDVILAVLKAIGSNIADYEKIPLPKRIPVSFRSRMRDMGDEERKMMMELFDMAPDYAVKTYHDIGRRKLQPLDLDDQSEGTKEIIKLIMCMHDAISHHKTVILDDCINGIHPKTMEKLMKFYLGTAKDAQLIISSQDFSHLDDPLLRRDSLRIVMKDHHGVSHVESMKLGDIHKNMNLRHYVETSDKLNVLPTIDDIMLEAAIQDYKAEMLKSGDNYYGELF